MRRGGRRSFVRSALNESPAPGRRTTAVTANVSPNVTNIWLAVIKVGNGGGGGGRGGKRETAVVSLPPR